MKKMTVIIKREENGMFLAVPNHSYNVGLYGYGKTADAAIDDLKKVCEEARPYCPELPTDLSFEVRYEIPGFLQEYSKLFSLAGLEQITGIHQKQLGHYLNGNTQPRPQTTRRIAESFDRFRRRLNKVEFA